MLEIPYLKEKNIKCKENTNYFPDRAMEMDEFSIFQKEIEK